MPEYKELKTADIELSKYEYIKLLQDWQDDAVDCITISNKETKTALCLMVIEVIDN